MDWRRGGGGGGEDGDKGMREEVMETEGEDKERLPPIEAGLFAHTSCWRSGFPSAELQQNENDQMLQIPGFVLL